MTQSSSSLAISSTEVVVLTTATFLVGGQAGEQVGRGGRFVKLVQDVAICPFCRHQRHCPSLKHLSLSSGVSFLGFSLVSTSMELGSLEGVFVMFGPGRVKHRLHSSSRVLVDSQELDPGASRDVLVAYL